MSKCENMTVGIDHYAKLTNENAEMYAVLKVCKSYLEEMELHKDSVIYKMICAALTEEGGEKCKKLRICEEEAMYEKKKAIKEVFKDGDWVFGIGPHEGCSQVFTGSSGDFQPFDYLNDYDPAHFRIATDKEIDEAKNKLID